MIKKKKTNSVIDGKIDEKKNDLKLKTKMNFYLLFGASNIIFVAFLLAWVSFTSS